MEPANRPFISGMPSVSQLLMENEKSSRKLEKVRQRRDHYARLYFKTLSELEETKWKLTQAVNTIKELQTRGCVSNISIPVQYRKMFHSTTTSPDSGTSLSPASGLEVTDHQRDHHQHIHASNPRHVTQYTEPNKGAWTRERGVKSPGDSPMGAYPQLCSPIKPHPGPLQLHPLPASHAHHSPSAVRQSAFSPPKQSVRWPATSSSPQHQQLPWSPHLQTVPLTATATAFEMPNSYVHSAKGAYRQDHAHSPQQSKTPEFHRSISMLPHAQERHMLGRQTDNMQRLSLSHDNLLELGYVQKRQYASPYHEATPFNHQTLPNTHTQGHHDDYRAEGEGRAPPHNPPAPHTSVPHPPAPPSTTSEDSEESGRRNSTCCFYDNLSSVDMLDLLLDIGSPHCVIQKLEIQRSGFGDPDAMKLLCSSLARNESIQQLSLPENGIGREALGLLLSTIKAGTNIKELKLRKNLIGQDCAALIKQFLTHTLLDSLVLTGNEIEQHGHLIDGELPSEFLVEYSSDDSGVHTVTPSTVDQSPSSGDPLPITPAQHAQLSASFKYLHI